MNEHEHKWILFNDLVDDPNKMFGRECKECGKIEYQILRPHKSN